MEPGTDLFTARIREFPQLVNNCHCSYISAWGKQSLRHVAEAVLGKTGVASPGGRRHLETAITACVEIHQSMDAVAGALQEVEGGFQVLKRPFKALSFGDGPLRSA
jgi:hypothetical protein